MQTNPAVKQSKKIEWSESSWNQFGNLTVCRTVRSQKMTKHGTM